MLLKKPGDPLLAQAAPFTETDILNLEVKVLISTLNAKLALATEENYMIEY